MICNPQADAIIQIMPNVYKLKGVESLTEIDIALTKAPQTKPKDNGPKDLCHRHHLRRPAPTPRHQHEKMAKRAFSYYFKSKGFTILAVFNPQLHPPEESQAGRSLFDGEIEITQKETAKGPARILTVRKLVDQRYLEDELTLTKEKLSP